MPDRNDLTALLGSRICHDLISPIGAIGNGVELLIMDGAGQSPEVQLIAESVANANARIRFFRIAFGASAVDQRIGRPEIQGILADLGRGSRLTIDWAVQTDMPRREVKLAFLLLMCLETAMSYGGTISVTCEADRWTLVGCASRFRQDPALWAMLGDRAVDHPVTPAQVHFLLAPEEIARQGRSLEYHATEAEIRLGF